MIKSPRPTPEFEPAQPIAAKAELATWLGKQAADTLLRVPVELKVSVMGVEGATIGFGADRLAVKLNDSALGESLADRAQQFCGELEQGVRVHGVASASQIRTCEVPPV